MAACQNLTLQSKSEVSNVALNNEESLVCPNRRVGYFGYNRQSALKYAWEPGKRPTKGVGLGAEPQNKKQNGQGKFTDRLAVLDEGCSESPPYRARRAAFFWDTMAKHPKKRLGISRKQATELAEPSKQIRRSD